MVGPRIFCIPALDSPLVGVLRRGPSEWCHVGSWNVEAGVYQPGAWFHGRLFPQKCDVSPDGRWLAYSAQHFGAEWSAGDTYEAISRLPWLHALAAWNAGSTYTRGIRFDERPGINEVGEPDVGDAAPCLTRYGLKVNRAEQFAVERRRGWAESPDTPTRDPTDMWDERRAVCMQKLDPRGSVRLEVEGRYAAFRSMPFDRAAVRYWLSSEGSRRVLADVQWADWARTGLLLTATMDGRLQAYDGSPDESRPVFEHDLSGMRPDPVAPPSWSTEW